MPIPDYLKEIAVPVSEKGEWTNAFDWIIVYKIKDGKRTKIFEMEAA